jgi:hypothetical protein
MECSARFSDCGTYRYSLERIWDEALPCACFVMLNPSTADATRDDPTIRRCISFARAWGFGGLRVLNLFAARAIRPRELFTQFEDPIGPGNDDALRSTAQCREVILAWGTHGSRLGRDAAVLKHFRDLGIKPKCLGLTKRGHPRHPLYVPAGSKPIQFATTNRGKSAGRLHPLQ